jgi:hypothetical protein
MYVPYIHNINHITSFVSVDPYYIDHMDTEKDQYQHKMHKTVTILKLQNSFNIWGLASSGLLAFSDLGPLCNYEYEQIFCYTRW